MPIYYRHNSMSTVQYIQQRNQKIKSTESKDCIAGEVLRGLVKPIDCKLFGSGCTPDHPMGAPMVSSEGTCAAFYKYKKQIM